MLKQHNDLADQRFHTLMYITVHLVVTSVRNKLLELNVEYRL